MLPPTWRRGLPALEHHGIGRVSAACEHDAVPAGQKGNAYEAVEGLAPACRHAHTLGAVHAVCCCVLC